MTDRDPELARMLELYRRAKAPQPELRERVWQSVQTEASAGPQASSAASAPGVLKLVVLAGALVGLAGVWLAMDASSSRDRHEPAAERAQPPAAPAAAAALEPASTPEPSVPAPEPTQQAAELAAPAPAPAPAPRSVPRPGSDRAQASSLAEELALLTAAQHAAHRAKPREALALLDKHARRFPDGAMAEEREAERVTALCALGRADQARRVAAAFLTRFAGSPQSARVSRACDAPEGSP